jgi:lipopolysaccharide transport system ATP-binding protein
MSTVIKVENLSKQYRLGTVGASTFREDSQRWWAKMRGKEDPFLKLGVENDRTLKTVDKFVWSLKDINFQVQKGDVLGVIGRNGAGKSTLLKILSKVTSPTTGFVKVKGRIASLLEVGTGFHPELTGRENIYLNGAILGMRKYEIKSKLDAIIAFAGVEKYVDTPVKRYSSGMYVRLAFAVAAHLESEILIIDEVLAVGDAEFQKKCLGKIGDVSKGEGRTVLFVSHNMASISTLCNRAILLKNGLLRSDSNTTNCINEYYGFTSNSLNKSSNFPGILHLSFFKLFDLKVLNSQSNSVILDNDEIYLDIDYLLEDSQNEYHFTFHLINELGEGLFSFSNVNKLKIKLGRNKFRVTFPLSFFQSGIYYLSFLLVKNKTEVVIFEKDLISFNVIDGARALGNYMGREPGYIRPTFEWKEINN